MIVAAGGSRRMGFDKLFADLRGRPVLAHSIAAISAVGDISDIVVVTSADRIADVQRLVEDGGFSKVGQILPGGKERCHSVHIGLDAAPAGCRWVAVHDAARPLVSPEDIARCIEAARESGAASLARPVSETVKRAGADGIVSKSVDRDGLWAMETPQVFELNALRQAYREVLESGNQVTDEVSAAQDAGMAVHLVASRGLNLKITYPGDLEIAEAMLERHAPKRDGAR